MFIYFFQIKIWAFQYIIYFSFHWHDIYEISFEMLPLQKGGIKWSWHPSGHSPDKVLHASPDLHFPHFCKQFSPKNPGTQSWKCFIWVHANFFLFFFWKFAKSVIGYTFKITVDEILILLFIHFSLVFKYLDTTVPDNFPYNHWHSVLRFFHTHHH